MQPSETITKLVKRYSLNHTDGNYLTIPPAAFYKGFTMRDYISIDGPGWRYAETWSNGYREIFIGREDRAIFTYCEGDLDLTVDADSETFERRLASAEAFYLEVAR